MMVMLHICTYTYIYSYNKDKINKVPVCAEIILLVIPS